MEPAYIALGSNIGDRQSHMQRAIDELFSCGVRINKVSSLYETRPWGVLDQPNFLNAVAEAFTDVGPHLLLETCLSIELAMGRRRARRHGPRTIDLDLLLFGATVVDDERLTLPHPHLTERAFVLAPLLEIAPDLRLPNGQRIARFLDESTADEQEVKVWTDGVLSIPRD